MKSQEEHELQLMIDALSKDNYKTRLEVLWGKRQLSESHDKILELKKEVEALKYEAQTKEKNGK